MGTRRHDLSAGLNTPPAILKGYLERVFGFGFAYGRNGHGSEPMMQGRKLISFSSSGAPLQRVQDAGAFDAIRVLFDNHLAGVCGFEQVGHLHFGQIVPGIWTDAARRMLESVKQTVADKFSGKT